MQDTDPLSRVGYNVPMKRRLCIGLLLLFLLAACHDAPTKPEANESDAEDVQATTTVEASAHEPTVMPTSSLTLAEIPADTAPPPTAAALALNATDAATATVASQTVPLVKTGRTPAGGYFIGAENAPLTMIDYSDFL